MRLHVRLGLAASFVAIALTTACGDSTGPSESEQAATLAARFDSIYVDAANRGGNYELRGLLATLLEVNAGLGAVPASINVATADGTEHWKGYEFLEISSEGESSDSTYVVLAYRESAAHTIAIAYYDASGHITEGGMVTNDTLNVFASDGDGTTSITTVGNSCGTFSSSLQNPQLASVAIAACDLAKFQTSMSLSLDLTPGVDPALESVSFDAQTLSGVRIVDAESSSRRVRALMHAAHNGNRF